MDKAHDIGERGHEDVNFFVFFGCGLAEGEVFGEEDIHGFGDEAWGGEVGDVFGPAFGGVAGFFGELALGSGDKFFAGLDAAGRELEEELIGGVAVLADEEDAGIGGIGFCVHCEDDDGAVVADDVAGDVDVAGFLDGVVGDPEDRAAVDLFGLEDLGFAGEPFGSSRGGLLRFCGSGRGGFRLGTFMCGRHDVHST